MIHLHRKNLSSPVKSQASTLVNALIIHEACLCHVLQTVLKHATGLPTSLYKTDPFVDGNQFFNGVRQLVTHFTKSPMQEKKLLRIQRELAVQEAETDAQQTTGESNSTTEEAADDSKKEGPTSEDEVLQYAMGWCSAGNKPCSAYKSCYHGVL